MEGFADAQQYESVPQQHEGAHEDESERQSMSMQQSEQPSVSTTRALTCGKQRELPFSSPLSGPLRPHHAASATPEEPALRVACHKSAGWTMPKREEKRPYRAKGSRLKRKLRNPTQNGFIRLMRSAYFVEDATTHDKVWDTAGMLDDFELFAGTMPADE